MKNKTLLLLLVAWLFCGVSAGNFFSNEAATSEREAVASASQNNASFSTSTSYDDLNVYATGTLSESSPSGLSYRITVTITSPSGRSNTTQSDWSVAPLTHTSGLSIGDEDGAYNVQATFERQNGTYDDYDNFDGSGNINLVGTQTEVLDVPPLITLTNLIFTDPTIPAIAGRTSNAVATVTYSNGVPQDTTVEMELNDARIGVGNPLYSLNAPSFDPIDAGTLTGNFNRTVKLKVPPLSNSPRSARVTFPFVLSQNTGSGTVNANIRIGNPVPQTSPAIQVNPPLGLNATLTISPTPTPAPSPTQTPNNGGTIGGITFCGGGGNGFLPGSGPPEPMCPSPIVIDVAGNGFNLTNNANGTDFDINGDGIKERLSWTSANSDDAWLVLDRNDNNRVDSGQELFGNFTPQPARASRTQRHGFLALAEYDKSANGGNSDGKITRRDAVFKKLRLWQDRNRSGISEAEELSRLPALDVVAIFLNYQESRRTDQHGNQFKYRARVRDRQGADVGRWAWDVFLLSAP